MIMDRLQTGNTCAWGNSTNLIYEVYFFYGWGKWLCKKKKSWLSQVESIYFNSVMLQFRTPGVYSWLSLLLAVLHGQITERL